MKIVLILISIEPYTDWNMCQFLIKVIIVICHSAKCAQWGHLFDHDLLGEIKRNTAQAQQSFRVQYCKFALAHTRISACACIGKENVMHETTVMYMR